MSGARMTLTIHDRELRSLLAAFADRSEEPGPFLKSAGEEMLDRIGERFRGEHGPDGESWARHSQATIRKRLKKYGNAPLTILRMRGHLAGNITYQVNGAVLAIGTDSPVAHYAAIHQFGGQAGRGHKVTIPARPYLGWGEEDMAIIEEEAAGYFLGGAERAADGD